MKKKKIIYDILAFTLLLSGCNTKEKYSEHSEQKEKSIGNIVVGNVRVQLLDENTIRFEEKYNNTFLDENTFLIPNRDQYKGVIYEAYKDNDYQYIEYNNITICIPLNNEGFKGSYIKKDNEVIYELQMIKNNGNLPSPSNTKDVYSLSDSPRIIVPDTGYSYDSYMSSSEELDYVSGYDIQTKAKDMYVLLPFKDAKVLRQAYVNLTGKSEMVRLANLGSWDSKYYAYSDKTAQEEINKYMLNDLPLDNLVIDTDWRKSSGTGIGYDIDTNLFPDMEGFLESVHDQNIEVMFNDHPEPYAGSTSVLDSSDIKYRSDSLKKLLSMGLDTWWYDRNWTVALGSPTPTTINPETWGLYLYHDITKQFYQEQAGNNEIYRRPVVMGNADNIYHGDYRGINNSASHRYSIQWTGDINCDSASLQQEVADIIKAGSDSIPYMSSDIGGHNGNPSNELYTRWVQYGALSPIFRPHSSKYNDRYRQPWLYGEDALNISREYINLRYRLMGLYYALAYENYQTGLPLIRSLEFNYQDDIQAKRYDEYLIGDNILFAPITEDIYNSIPSDWISSPVKAKYYNDTSLNGDVVVEEVYDNIDFNWGKSNPAIGVSSDNFSASFETTICPSKDTKLAVKVDDGVRVYVDGVLAINKFFSNASNIYDIIDLKEDKEYDIKIEYYEGSGDAVLNLLYKNTTNLYSKSVYLPEGQWMNTFTGEIYEGQKTYDIECDLYSSPLFIRLGSMTPLVENAMNTAEIDWNNIAYDVYPSKTASDSSFLYEDDYETTAYKLGQNRVSNYSYYFDEKENAVIIKLDAGIGSYEYSSSSENKNYSIRYHLINKMDSIDKITVNGKIVSAKYITQDENAFPFSYNGGSVEGDIISIDFNSSTNKENIIKIYLNK